MKILAMLFLLYVSLPLKAQQTKWKVSIAILGGASSLDIASSWNGYESNPLARNLSGKFSLARAIPLKIGVVGGICLLQRYILRKHHSQTNERIFTWQNYVISAMYAGVAIRNWKVKKSYD